MSPHADLQAVFEEEAPAEIIQRIEEEDDLEDAILENSFAGAISTDRRSISPGSVLTRRRRLSSAWPGPVP